MGQLALFAFLLAVVTALLHRRAHRQRHPLRFAPAAVFALSAIAVAVLAFFIGDDPMTDEEHRARDAAFVALGKLGLTAWALGLLAAAIVLWLTAPGRSESRRTRR